MQRRPDEDIDVDAQQRDARRVGVGHPTGAVEGHDGVIFPATFADVGYNIDGDLNGDNICLIDSVGSQANRIEPLFAEKNYAHLVPQVVIKAGEKSISILEAGHRAGLSR